MFAHFEISFLECLNLWIFKEWTAAEGFFFLPEFFEGLSFFLPFFYLIMCRNVCIEIWGCLCAFSGIKFFFSSLSSQFWGFYFLFYLSFPFGFYGTCMVGYLFLKDWIFFFFCLLLMISRNVFIGIWNWVLLWNCHLIPVCGDFLDLLLFMF